MLPCRPLLYGQNTTQRANVTLRWVLFSVSSYGTGGGTRTISIFRWSQRQVSVLRENHWRHQQEHRPSQGLALHWHDGLTCRPGGAETTHRAPRQDDSTKIIKRQFSSVSSISIVMKDGFLNKTQLQLLPWKFSSLNRWFPTIVGNQMFCRRNKTIQMLIYFNWQGKYSMACTWRWCAQASAP